MTRSTRVSLHSSRGVSTIPLTTKHFSGAPHRLLAGFTPENSSPSRLGGGSNKKSPNHKDFPVPPNAILKCIHTMLSIPQISTKLEREIKGRRWIFNLSSTPTKGSQFLLQILAQTMGERKG